MTMQVAHTTPTDAQAEAFDDLMAQFGSITGSNPCISIALPGAVSMILSYIVRLEERIEELEKSDE